MELWFFFLVSISICALLKSLIDFTFTAKSKLPPGPITLPIIGNLIWLRKSFFQLEPILKDLHSKFGSIVTIRIGSRPAIFISDRSIAHHLLIQKGAVFADRPRPLPTNLVIDGNQSNISSSFYGPTWRLFRRNLASEILHPSRIKSYAHARNWVLEILCNQLKLSSESGEAIQVVDHFQYTMFCLLVLMCFGDKLEESKIREIEQVQRKLLLSFTQFNFLNFWPKVTKTLFRKRWEELHELKSHQHGVLIPLIRARLKSKNQAKADHDDEYIISYVDSLLDLQLPDGNRKLEENEMVNLCSEFLNAGTDTTSTALQWIMAELVKNPDIQNKLFEEINGVVESNQEKVEEDDLHKMPYLKAVILEGLRRHPPGHFVLPHAVTKDVEFNGYVIPKNGTVNFMVAEIGWNSEVWEDPMAFKPERFMGGNGGEVFDITGTKEIKMMPFGTGRRICPAYGLAILHLEYFVANLVRKFNWTAAGGVVDLSEKQEFTVVMKQPLTAYVSPRL